MSYIAIDPQACDRCGLCVAECPLGLLEPVAGGPPAPVADAEARCIRCGHCISVCPQAALSLGGTQPESLAALPGAAGGAGLTPEAAEMLLRSRRSVRRYKKDPVDRALLLRLMETAGYAPSGMNARPARFVVAEGPETVHRLAGLTAGALRRLPYFLGFLEAWDQGRDVILRGAPCVVAVHAAASGFDHTVDCAIALTYFELAAHAFGLGTCWAGLLMLAARDCPEINQALGIPEGHRLLGALMVGWPKYGFSRLPPRPPLEVRWV